MRGKRRIVRKWSKKRPFSFTNGVLGAGVVLTLGGPALLGAALGVTLAATDTPEKRDRDFFFELDSGKVVRVGETVYNRYRVGDFTWDIFPTG